MSAGFQAVEVMSTIGKFEILQSAGTLDSNERFGPETVSGTKKISNQYQVVGAGPTGHHRCRTQKPKSVAG
jgi:hypothetical protein